MWGVLEGEVPSVETERGGGERKREERREADTQTAEGRAHPRILEMEPQP